MILGWSSCVLWPNGARRPTTIPPVSVNDLRIDRSMSITNMVMTPGPSPASEPGLKRNLNSELYYYCCEHEIVAGSNFDFTGHHVARNGGDGMLWIDSISSEVM